MSAQRNRKPLRLRSTCTECYMAKVRCSGDKNGCNRCRRNSLTCEYAVSMVGRASKKRRTQASDRDSTIESQVPAFTTAHAMGNFTTASSEEDLERSLQNFPGDYTDTQLLLPDTAGLFWPPEEAILPDTSKNDPFFGLEEGLLSGEIEPNQRQELLTNKEFTTRNGDNRDQTVKSIRSRLTDHTESRVPLSYRDRSTVSKYPHAATLMAVIECLEEQLQISHVAIDQAMRVNRQSIKNLREVSTTEGFRSCQSCPLLMMTIMDLIVGLYELVILTIQKDHRDESVHVSLGNRNDLSWNLSGLNEASSNASSPESALSSGSDAPVFQFGCLEFDSDEQEIFRTAMMRRDLRKCKEMIRYCSQEVSQRKRKADCLTGAVESRRPMSGQIHASCYEEMEYRVDELLISLPVSCGHS